MRDTMIREPFLCSETGLLFAKQACLALRRQDGSELWLEMDRIPSHLIDQFVRIEGRFYHPDLVSVDLIGPA
jgi:Protein of unknown function (DUF5818)